MIKKACAVLHRERPAANPTAIQTTPRTRPTTKVRSAFPRVTSAIGGFARRKPGAQDRFPHFRNRAMEQPAWSSGHVKPDESRPTTWDDQSVVNGSEYHKFQRWRKDEKVRSQISLVAPLQDRWRSEKSQELADARESPLTRLIVENTLLGAAIGGFVGSVRASWLDVPNEFGVRKVDKRGTVRLILADAAIFGALANIITVTKAVLESQTKSDGKWTAFGGAFLAGLVAGGLANGPRYGVKMGTVLGASFMAALLVDSVVSKFIIVADMADFRLMHHSTVDDLTVGVVPVLALKEEIKERKHLTRPTVVDPQYLPYRKLLEGDVRDRWIKSGGWDAPVKKVIKMDEKVWDKWYKDYVRTHTSENGSGWV